MKNGLSKAIESELKKKHFVRIAGQKFELKELSLEESLEVNQRISKLVGPEAKSISKEDEMRLVARIAQMSLPEEIDEDTLVRYLVKTGGRFSPLYLKMMEVSGIAAADRELRDQDFPG